MIISDKLFIELAELEKHINSIMKKKSVDDIQMETFLRILERRRYNILTQIKLYNKSLEFDAKKIRTISDDYKIVARDNLLKIYIPEPMPSYKNLKTHAYKNILLNLIEITKPYKDMFKCPIFVYIKIFDKITGWDVDNKYIKPITDSLIASGVIEDDNIEKMFYTVKGEFFKIPHTEVYILPAEKVVNFLEDYIM